MKKVEVVSMYSWKNKTAHDKSMFNALNIYLQTNPDVEIKGVPKRDLLRDMCKIMHKLKIEQEEPAKPLIPLKMPDNIELIHSWDKVHIIYQVDNSFMKRFVCDLSKIGLLTSWDTGGKNVWDYHFLLKVQNQNEESAIILYFDKKNLNKDKRCALEIQYNPNKHKATSPFFKLLRSHLKRYSREWQSPLISVIHNAIDFKNVSRAEIQVLVDHARHPKVDRMTQTWGTSRGNIILYDKQKERADNNHEIIDYPLQRLELQERFTKPLSFTELEQYRPNLSNITVGYTYGMSVDNLVKSLAFTSGRLSVTQLTPHKRRNMKNALKSTDIDLNAIVEKNWKKEVGKLKTYFEIDSSPEDSESVVIDYNDNITSLRSKAMYVKSEPEARKGEYKALLYELSQQINGNRKASIQNKKLNKLMMQPLQKRENYYESLFEDYRLNRNPDKRKEFLEVTKYLSQRTEHGREYRNIWLKCCEAHVIFDAIEAQHLPNVKDYQTLLIAGSLYESSVQSQINCSSQG